jgi:hypothetical protein
VGDAELGEQRDEGAHGLSGDRDASALKAGSVGRLAAGVVELAQRPVDPGEQRCAEPVKPDPPPGAVEQRHTEFFLQPGDRAADRWLGYVEIGCGAADVLALGTDD